jgi:hypothetical protein
MPDRRSPEMALAAAMTTRALSRGIIAFMAIGIYDRRHMDAFRSMAFIAVAV